MLNETQERTKGVEGRTSQIRGQTGCLKQNAENLAKLAEDLMGRLGAVMRTSVPQLGQEKVEDFRRKENREGNDLVPLAMELQSIHESLIGTRRILEGILERLEI